MDRIKKSKVVYAQISIKEKFALVKENLPAFCVAWASAMVRVERMLLTGEFLRCEKCNFYDILM